MSASALSPTPDHYRPGARLGPVPIAEAARLRSRGLLQDLIVCFDTSGMIRWMNGAARAVLGDTGTMPERLPSAGSAPRLVSLSYGDQRFWIAATSETAVQREEDLRHVAGALFAICAKRRPHNLELIRPDGLFQTQWRRVTARRAGNHLIAALEDERGRIARELHDDAGQTLAGIKLNLELVEQQLDSASSEALKRLARSKALAVRALDQIRRISHELYPPDWSERDFASVLEFLIEDMGLRAKFEVDVGSMEASGNLAPAAKTTFYRTLQEGLRNVSRHSDASRVKIRMPVCAGGVQLTVEDNGRGFDPAAIRSGNNGIGLRSMRQAVEALGGKFEVTSAPGRGVALSVFLPAETGRR